MSGTDCPICLKIIKGKSNLNRHLVRIHFNARDRYNLLRCPLCPSIFMEENKEYLNAHVIRDHKEDLTRLNATLENVRDVTKTIINYFCDMSTIEIYNKNF